LSGRFAPGVVFAAVEPRSSDSASSSATGSTVSASTSVFLNSTAASSSTVLSSDSVSTGSPTVVSSTSASTSAGPESLICLKLNGAVISNALKADFAVDCNHGIIGSALQITDNRKRQAVSLPTTPSDCVDVCSTSGFCVGTTFEIPTGVCTYYSTIQSTYIDAGLDSALRLGSNSGSSGTTTVTVLTAQIQTSPVTVGGGSSSLMTSTVTSTAVQTVYPK
jgi:hypothetical protein